MIPNDALSLLASATDLLNSWAREMGVQEARTEDDIKGVINRLWDGISRLSFGEVVCVEWRESKLVRGDLKKKLRKLRIKGATNRPEFYREPENLFWLKDRIDG